MTLTPEATQALYADDSGLGLEAQLQAAYLRNVEGGLARPAETTAHVAAAAIAQASQAPDLPHPAMANLDPRTHGVLGEAIARSEAVFATFVGIDTPSIAELASAGFDLNRYKTAFNSLEAEGKQPELLLVPRLSVAQWKELYQRLQDDATVNADGRLKNGGIYINDDVAAEWDSLTNTLTSLPSYNNPHDGITWHLSVVPGTDQPTETRVPHNDPTYEHQHPTVNDYLTLQAGRLQRSEDPIDSSTYTWLDGTIQDASRAPGGFWYSGVGQVDVYWSGVGSSSDSLGVRPAVW